MGHAVNGSTHHETDQSLIGIRVIETRVMRGGIPQIQALAISIPFRIENSLVVRGRRGRLKPTVNTVTQYVKITTGAISWRAGRRPAQRFRQENKIPFLAADRVDDV